ncbi:LytR/AlgR family response regulator transcription factor [Aquimarina hainanensis]|uniref:LytR/AlgR family response regulator transcription factor n=1 Tax=Aquimarina hainanensis TaxID=1578017 RepID=A0ABW5N9Q9_9FLAO
MKDKLSCIIIDDEKKDRENLTLLINTYCPQVQILGEASDKNTIVRMLTSLQPDLVFMDIQIGEFTAFEILSEIEELSFNIVFVSAYDQYAIRGYKYNAIDYILKPIDIHKLTEVIQRISDKIQQNNLFLPPTNAATAFNPMSKKISVTDAKGIHVLEVHNILYCLSNGNYTTFILSDKKEIIISKNLKYFETKLINYGFTRVHKSYLVNLEHINYLIKEDGGAIIMQNKDALPISKNFKKELYKRMNIL